MSVCCFNHIPWGMCMITPVYCLDLFALLLSQLLWWSLRTLGMDDAFFKVLCRAQILLFFSRTFLSLVASDRDIEMWRGLRK